MQKIYKWFIRYRLHFLLWAIYMTYEVSVAAFAFKLYGKPLLLIFHYTVIVSLFYIHALWGMPFAFRNRSTAVWKLLALVIFEATTYLALAYSGDIYLYKIHVIRESFQFDHPYIIQNVYRGLYFIGFSSGYYILLTYNQERRRSAELEKQRLNEIISRERTEQELSKAQNAFLKAQINPHFLFNTLDFIYHKVMSESPEAADAVITLAEMMRFAIDADKMGEFIKLGDELEQVQNLVALNNLRKNQTVPFELNYQADVEQLQFIPLVLLTLAENIFKHGDLNTGKQARLDVSINNSELLIHSQNVSGRAINERSNQTGLLNLKRRLHFAYGDAVSFTYGIEDDGQFNVWILVPLDVIADASTGIDKALLPAGADHDQIHG
jgi:two-component system LytT family sensor kinase